MIQPEVILRDTAMLLVPLVATGVLVDGAWGSLGVASTGLVILANLWVMGRLTRRLTAYMAGEDPEGGLAIGILVIKFPLALVAVTGLTWTFGALPVALGMSAVVFAVFMRGLINLIRTPADADVSQGA